MSKLLPRNVWVLTLAQAMIMCVNSVIVFAGGLVGTQLAPNPALSTLPVAATVVGTALSTVPLGVLMKKWGRKRTFTISLFASIIVAFASTATIALDSFFGFTLTTLLFGFTSATVMQFRFAAMECVPKDQIPKAASTVLLGGIVAAFIGPEAALLGKDLLAAEYAGSFLPLAGLFTLGIVTIQFYYPPIINITQGATTKLKTLDVFKRPIFLIAVLSSLVGYSIMTFVMTATPVSMHIIDGHSLSNTKWVIQSHIMAMFLPSLITSRVIVNLGMKRTMQLGLILYVLCIFVGTLGHGVWNYWLALILLGVGWNFLFISGTALLPQSYAEQERFKVQTIMTFWFLAFRQSHRFQPDGSFFSLIGKPY